MLRFFFVTIFMLAALGTSAQHELKTHKKLGIEPILIDLIGAYRFSEDIEGSVAADTTQWKYQVSAAAYAAKGDYKNALRHWDLAMSSREYSYSEAEIDSINEKYKKVSARSYILERAAGESLMIINEAHHNSFHRFYTRSLLRDLYDLGYRYLGLEALANGTKVDSLLQDRKYPSQNSGSYIIEPQFGNMVREALEIGFIVFPYEQTSGVNNTEREIEQARYIADMMKANPGEKFLIHCGFDHVYEGKHDWWGKAMAGRLKEFTGVDPFTIHQVNFSEKGDSKYNHPFLKAIDPLESTVLLDKQGKPFQDKRKEAYTDIAILHPTTQYIDGRANWLFKGANRKVRVDLSNFNGSYPVMVMAYKQSEDIKDAVPVDIYEVDDQSQPCYLALPKGAYRIAITNGEKSNIFNIEVK